MFIDFAPGIFQPKINSENGYNLLNLILVAKNKMPNLATSRKKAIFLGFVTTFGLSNNEHSMSLVQHSLTMDALFDFVG